MDVGVTYKKNSGRSNSAPNANGIQISSTEMGICNNTKPLVILLAQSFHFAPI